MIAKMHAIAPRREGGDLANALGTLKRTCAQGADISGMSVAWQSRIDQLASEYTRLAPLLESRRLAGKVRRVHGDLHLKNLCIFQGNVTAFDAITFDEELASCDVLYDLAFLLMDLRHVGLPRHANATLNRYWDESGEDEAALALLPFFMSLRASVRMAVALEAGAGKEADDYGRLSEVLLTPVKSEAVVALGGLSGTGKSALAKELAPSMPGPAGARILRSDVLRKRLMGIPASARADAQAYAPVERARVYRELISAGLAASAGASVILDATFQTPSARRLTGSAFGARLLGYWLHAPLATRLSRVSRRKDDASDADVDVAAAQREPDKLEAGWGRLDATRSLADNRALICGDLGFEGVFQGERTRAGDDASD
jgi:predicted kinase